MIRRNLKTWFGLTMVRRWLLVRALVCVAAARVLLWVLPFPMLHRWWNPSIAGIQSSVSPDQYVWAVRNASRLIPASTCLTKALALRWMLARAGYASVIRIGVNRQEAEGFKAHAWVERDGQIVLGAEEAGRYSQLLAW